MTFDAPLPGAPPQRGGVLLRFADEGDAGAPSLTFIPADVALRLTEIAALTPVPGLVPPAMGIALADGEVVTVFTLGGQAPRTPRSYRAGADWPLPGADRAVLCQVGALRVAIVGGTVVATGYFDAIDSAIAWRGELVPALDIRALYAQAEAAVLAGGATRPRSPPTIRPPSLRPPRAAPPTMLPGRLEEAAEERTPDTKRTEGNT